MPPHVKTARPVELAITAVPVERDDVAGLAGEASVGRDEGDVGGG